MASRLSRAGRDSQFEKKFPDDGRIYPTWDGASDNLSKIEKKSDLADLLRQVYPSALKGRISQNCR
jgi:hypothetical protein